MSDTPDTRDAAVDGTFGFVLATRDHAHGPSFWNNDYGFGPLFNATVFSEAEAGEFSVPIANDEPEGWPCPPAQQRPERRPLRGPGPRWLASPRERPRYE
jgi:hypothetical protein